MSDEIPSSITDSLPEMRISQALEGYKLAAGGNHLSGNTLSLYCWGLERLVSYLKDPDVGKISETQIEQFFTWLETGYVKEDGKPLAPSSIQNTWKAVRSFFGWMLKHRMVKKDVSLIVEMPDSPDTEIWPLSFEEMNALIEGCQYTRTAATDKRKPFKMVRRTAARDTALIAVLLDTGIRSSECCRLTVPDIDMKSGEVWVMPFGTRRKSKGRYVYISDVTKHYLWQYLVERKDGYVFITEDGNPFDKDSLRQALNRIAEKTEVKDCHPHRFRHTFAVQYILNGGDPFTLMRLLGHTTMRMVNKYLEFTRKDIAVSHRKASPVDNWFGKRK